MDNITFEEFEEMLSEIADSLPREIFVNLNGGINLLPNALPHPEVGMLYILGQYHYGGYLGRYITIYYGSFAALYKKNSRNNIKKQIDKVLRHEFLHHLESMAGEKGLEIKDAIDLAKYKRWQK